MSNISPEQFGQLPMFLPTKKVIDEVHKIDHEEVSSAVGWRAERNAPIAVPPSEQWDEVSRELDERQIGWAEERIQEGSVEPIALYHHDQGAILADGHHRLAAHARQGIEEIPVVHRERPAWGYQGPNQ